MSLVLSRKTNERIHIGYKITVTVTKISGRYVELAISAPKSMRILRGELLRESRQIDWSRCVSCGESHDPAEGCTA